MRRSALYYCLFCLSGAACGISTSMSPEPSKGSPVTLLGRALADNPIPAENELLGNPEWRDGWSAYSHHLEVYLSTDSQSPGDYVSVKVSSNSLSTATAEVYRLGYYGGAGARRVWSGGPFNVSMQPNCPMDPTTGRVECN